MNSKIFMDKDNEVSNARKELSMADDLLSERLNKLKSVQDDYDKMVVSFEALVNESLQDEVSGAELFMPTQQKIESHGIPNNVKAEAFKTYTITDTISHNEPDVSEKTEINTQLREITTDLVFYTGKNDNISDKTIKEDTAKQQNGGKQEDFTLAEVLSYIFNGGAIAFIIPAGFIRRKSDKEILV